MLEKLFSRETWIVSLSLALLVAIAWAYLTAVADAMDAMTPPRPAQFMWLMPMGEWGPREFALGLLMWSLMMIGMMVPSAAPMVLLYARMRAKEIARGGTLPSCSLFLAGYLAVWALFSVAATVLQWVLNRSALISDAMLVDNVVVAGSILVAAGLYQFSPLKRVCLARCRSPLQFLSRHWRSGRLGVFRLGLLHGGWCLGCCWMMMLVLFAVGVMNLLWVAALSALVLLEKLTTVGPALAKLSGIAFVVFGALVLLRAM